MITSAGNRPGAEAPAIRPDDDGAFVTRIDAHCHSHASDKPVVAAAGLIGCPECYSEPERVYDQAVARGMDLVTITDHDTIAGAMELVERGFDRFIVGQEVSVRFPEDRCLMHVLVWGLSPEQDERLTRDNLRADIYAFAAWLRDENLPHALAHPLYIQNGRLTRWHIERSALLFKGFECLNGAHAAGQSSAIVRYLDRLTPAGINRLAREHGIEPLWPRTWEKARTGGSDDHALLNIGRTWTEVRDPHGKITDPHAFFRRAMGAESGARGVGGHSALLAHQIATVGANYYARRLYERRSPAGKYLSSRLLRFAGVHVKAPTKKRVAAYKVAQKMWAGKKGRKKSLPIVRALRRDIGPVLDRYPDIRDRLHPDGWTNGSAVSEHERMAEFVQDLTEALSRSMKPGALKSYRKRDPGRIAEHLASYAVLHLAQLPYLYSLFHQNKERNFLERFEHESSEPGTGSSVLERPMRVSLFTDTLADINGVCRFIQNVADTSLRTGADLQVITSTRHRCPDLPNVHNFDPVVSTKMPRYDTLDITLPPILKILRHVDHHQPDVIHVSTPGPVGCVGFLAARMLRVPVLGVYHTDFPAYIDRLFDDHGMTLMTQKFMQAFYKPFSAVFTRSEDYARSLTRLGLDRERIVSLLPGFDADQFHVRFRDTGVWPRLGCRPDTVKVLYVGRVSVEKNLPFLTDVWRAAHKRCQERGVAAELVVVGDGPFHQKMARELRGRDATFLGFRHGDELSTIYASSDLFAFPSTTDTLGQVVMESQGSGLPVLVTDQGGPKEVVEHGRTGFVLRADDPGAWIEHLVTLITDHDRRRAMGAAAHASMQQYSLHHSFKHFWDVHTRAWHDHLARRGIQPHARPRPEGAAPAPIVPDTVNPGQPA